MKFVKLGLNGLSVPMQIQRCRNIVTQTTGNSDFPTPNPPLATVTTAIDTLETSFENAADGGKTLKALVRLNRKALLALMTQLAAYVQETSGGDEAIILGSGMDVRATKTPPQPLDAVQNLRVKAGKLAGTIAPRWQKLTGTVVYMVGTSTDGINWTNNGNSTRTTIILSGFTSSQQVYVRIAAVNAKGQGPWCPVAQGKAA